MTNYITGHTAEQRAARFLERLGFTVRGLNWRTRFCEIDIIAERAGRIYFVEVKYRRSGVWGAGIEYVTAKKLARMRFAAGFWLAQQHWSGDAQLAVVSIDGSTFRFEPLDT